MHVRGMLVWRLGWKYSPMLLILTLTVILSLGWVPLGIHATTMDPAMGQVQVINDIIKSEYDQCNYHIIKQVDCHVGS